MDFLSLENESVITPREVVRASLAEKGVTEKAWRSRNDRLYRGGVGGRGMYLNPIPVWSAKCGCAP